jgi:hypothetical protein
MGLMVTVRIISINAASASALARILGGRSLLKNLDGLFVRRGMDIKESKILVANAYQLGTLGFQLFGKEAEISE